MNVEMKNDFPIISLSPQRQLMPLYISPQVGRTLKARRFTLSVPLKMLVFLCIFRAINRTATNFQSEEMTGV